MPNLRLTRPYLVLLVAAATAVTGCNGGGSTSAGLASPTATAESPATPGTGSPTSGQLSEQDRTWLRKAHQGNLAEIAAGELAERKGNADAVKELGAMLVKDHSALDEELVATAKRLEVELPKNASGDQKEVLTELRDASRSDFDEEFVEATREAHEQAIEAARAEVQNGSSPEVKQLAEKALPKLEQHLEEAEKITGGQTPAPDSGTPAPESS